MKAASDEKRSSEIRLEKRYKIAACLICDEVKIVSD